jgi:hypothetical protein
MADKNRRTVQFVEHVGRGLDVALERQRLVLHDAHAESIRREQVIYVSPAGPIHEPAVDKNYVLHTGHG